MKPDLDIVVFSDTHVGNFKKFDVDGSRLKNSCSAIFDIIEWNYENGIRTFYFGGDLTDTPKVLEINVAVALVKLFAVIKRKFPDIKIYAIDGNHDHYERNLLKKRTVSSIDVIKPIMGKILVDVSDSHAEVAPNLYVHGVPYYEIKSDFRQALEDRVLDVAYLKKEKPDSVHHLLIHQTPKMFDSIIPHDIDPNDELFDSFDEVFCGHIHTHMVLSPKFTVIGNNIHRDSADAGKKKGFLLFNPSDSHRPTMIPLEGYPEYVVVSSEQETEQDGNFHVVKPEKTRDESVIIDESFSASNTEQELVNNFWKAVDGKNKDLLDAGLECLNYIKKEEDDE